MEVFYRYQHDPLNYNSIPGNDVKALSLSEDKIIWTGINPKGISTLNPFNNRFYNLMYNIDDASSINSISNIYSDNKGSMWICTSRGLYIYNKHKWKFNHFKNIIGDSNSLINNEVISICDDLNGNVWVATKTGLQILARNTGSFTRKINNINGVYNFDDDDNVQHIFRDKKNYMWISSTGGPLKRYDSKTGEITRFNDFDGGGFDSRCIFEDKEENLWVGSWTGGGITVFDKNRNFKRQYLNVKNDFGDFSLFPIYHVYEDSKGYIWIATFDGLGMLNPETESFTNFGIGDGVQGLDFIIGSSCKSESGEMFFGGINGFNSFHPDSISENKSVPNIVITGFKIFNKDTKFEKSITKTDEVTISHKENFFSFDFAALDYTNPSKNQYAYMLEGIDKDWNYIGNVKTANYTDISPGEYIFRVKASNNDAVWNEKGVSLKLTIIPPWYKTFWFYILAAIFLAGILGFIFVKRSERIRKDKKSQEEFTRKLLNSQESDRKRVAAELHDSLAQHLLIIKSKAKMILKKSVDSKIKTQLNEISELSSSTLDEVRKISYNLRPYELDRLGLTKTLLSTIDNVNESTNIVFNIEVDDIDKMLEDEIEINVYRIVQEILNNIIKHSEATEVKGSITNLEKEIVISISDNGKGFYIEKKILDTEEKGFGLKGISERVKLFGGVFKIHSDPGKGTQIEVCIPFKK